MSTEARTNARAAVVGMGCRLPGGVDGPDELWDAFVEGRDLVGEVSPGRWPTMLEQLHPEQRPAVPWPAGVLDDDDIESFDHTFFGIGPAEAAEMDPQQRLLLEVVVEALADAGIAPAALAGRRVGVYVGAASFDHATVAFAAGRRVSMHTAAGAGMSILANRISYCLDLRGPSITFDTACSASLTATHYAYQDLAHGRVQLAIVAGANLQVNASITASFVDGGVLSPRGRCHTLDAGADGYVRSDGIGALVLKPESRSVADSDRIYALVAGSAINSDGRSSGGLHAPSQEAQQELLTEALADAGTAPGQIDYAELHGTGTRSGDRVEAHAVATVLGDGRDPGNPLPVGSAKTTLGHTEGAAGVVGVMKTALMLHHGRLVANLHHKRLPSGLARLPLRVPTAVEPWPPRAHRRRAVISAFGFGGANASVVVAGAENAPFEEAKRAEASEAAEVVPLSALTGQRLGLLARAWAPAIAGERDLGAVAATAIHRRELGHPHRAAVVATTPDEAAAALDALAQGRPHPGLVAPQTSPTRPGPVVWMFAGHGCHHRAMVLRCYDRFGAFARAFDSARDALATHLGRAPWRPGEPIADFATAQHAIWMVQMAQAALWREWGYTPDAVVGHSIGEVAAAHTAGALSLGQAARLVALRSDLLARTATHGGLLVVALSAEQTQQAITHSGHDNALSIAALNGTHATVVSGAEASLEELRTELASHGVEARRVADDVPAHSPLVAQAAEELRQQLANLKPCPATIPLHPTAPRHQGNPSPRLDRDYWPDQMRHTVAFLPTVHSIAAEHPDATWVELGGRSTLAAGVLDTLTDLTDSPRVVAAGHPTHDDDAAMLRQLAALYTHGHPPRHWPYPRRSPVRLPVAWHHTDHDDTTAHGAHLRTALANSDHAALRTALLDMVAAVVNHPPDDLDTHTPLEDLGVTSILTWELRAQLRTHLHDLPTGLPSHHATITSTATTLLALTTQRRPT